MRNVLNKASACIIAGTMILSGLTTTAFADELNNNDTVSEQSDEKVYTDHNTYYIGDVEYNLDGTKVDDSHVCNYVPQKPAAEPATLDTSSGAETDESKDPTISDKTEDAKKDEATDNPENPREDENQSGSTTTDTPKQEPSVGDITVLPDNTDSETKNDLNNSSNVTDTFYHADSNGYISSVKNALKMDNYLGRDWGQFFIVGNPFAMPQCTYFAWSRFYQVYGFDSGARGDGKNNAAEIVSAHRDKFSLSSTPSGGAVFSAQANTLYPQYGHVGFVEAFDGYNMWISEGNYTVGNQGGYIHIYKTTLPAFKAQYPDVVFAVPNGSVLQSSILSNVSFGQTSYVNSNTKKVMQTKKLKYKTTKRKFTIHDENGEELKQYKFKVVVDEKVVAEV